LNFAVKYGVIRAGDAQLAVQKGERGGEEGAYRFVSTARSSRFFSTFFEVDDRVESVWSPAALVPIRFEKRTREGSYKRDFAYRFDHQHRIVVDGKGHAGEILPGSQDILSSFYMVRSRRLAPGDSLQIPTHADGKNYMLTVKVHRRERVEVPAGGFDCLVVEPLLRTAGLFRQEGRLLIWLTEDSRRMPVRMEGSMAVGAIVVELESFRLGRPPEASAGSRTGAPADANGEKKP
jgi:hypothetical protein